MIRREHEAVTLNSVANDKSVRELMFLGMPYPQDKLDFSEAVADAKTVALTDDNGFCSVFQWSAPGVYQCHIMAVKEARGASMMKSAREMLDYMKQHGARLVWGQPSIYNRAAICFIRRMGLKSAGKGSDPFLGEVEYFVTEGL